MAHDNEMLKEYLIEAQENLAELESALLDLEQSPQSRPTLDTCFRHAHTIKGASGYMGFTRTNSLTHTMENVFDALRKGTISPSAGLMSVLFQAYDRLSKLVEEVAFPDGETSDTSDILEALKGILEKKDEPQDTPPVLSATEMEVPKPLEAVQPEPSSEVLSAQDVSLIEEGQTEEDQELIEIYKEEINSLYNQLSAASDLDVETAQKIMADMQRVTNYVGYDNIIAELNALEQELSTLWQEADDAKIAQETLCARLFKIFEPVTGGMFVFKQDDIKPDVSSAFEDDPELYGIFVDFIKENIAPLKAIPDIPDEAWIVGCQHSLEQIRSSAHYMDYMEIVTLMSEWEEKLTESLTSMQSAGAFNPIPMRSMWQRLVMIVPELSQYNEVTSSEEEKAGLEAEETGEVQSLAQSDDELLQEFAGISADISFDESLDQSMEQSFAYVAEESAVGQVSEAMVETMPEAIEAMIEASEEKDTLGMAMDSLFDEHTKQATPAAEPASEPLQFEDKDKIAAIERLIEPTRAEPLWKEPIKTEPTPKSKLAEPSAASQTVRLELEKVEGLLSEVSEMVVLRSALGHLAEDLRDVYSGLRAHHVSISSLKPLKEVITKVGEHTASMSRVVQNMQDTVMRMRMLPVKQLFDRYIRVVRDLSVKLGKQVALVMDGEETGLDKRVMEQMADPMLHLIRNAVDHGCETSEERKLAGKPEKATILLSAAQEAGQVVIRIRDDGKGLDRNALIKKAASSGILKEVDAQKMSDDRVWDLIFLPGISTAATVSDTSGRGVGMDVVKRNVEKIGGSITISSHAGWGTEIAIRIPLTLAIIKALLVKVGRQTMAIPLNAVQETIRIKRDETSQIEGFEVFSLRQDTVPLIRLAKIFKGTGAEQNAEKLFVVLVKHGDIEAGLSVDKLIGQQEVVIKPLAEYLTDQPGFAGATILGDGSIAFIVDIPAVLSRAKDFIRASQKAMERNVISLDLGKDTFEMGGAIH